MHILQVSVRYPPAVGGVEAYAALLSEALADRGHRIDVHTSALGWPAGATPRSRPLGPKLTVHPTVTPPGLPGYPVLRRLARAIVASGADVVHGHGHHLCSADVPALLRRIRTTPFVLHPHYHPATTPKWRLYERTIGRLSIRADVTAVVSRFEQGMIERSGFRIKRFELVPPAVRASDFRDATPPEFFRQHGLRPDAHPLLLYAGRIAAHKGLEDLLLALPAIRDAVPEVRLVLIGPDWGDRSRLESLARETGITDAVIFSGPLPREEVLRAFCCATLFVLPSRYEAFGIVLIEAMAAGLPVVGAAAAAIPEVVDDGTTGVLFPPGDVSALVRTLTDLLLDERARRSLQRSGLEQVARRHSPEVQAESMEAIYRSLPGSG